MQARSARVFGPAYLDRVLQVDRPLVDPVRGGTLDRSVQGRCDFDDATGSGLALRCAPDFDLSVNPLPEGWPGPFGVIENAGGVHPDREVREVGGLAWHDDLGGMGAGFAKAFRAKLVWPAGPPGDVVTETVCRLLDAEGISHRPARVWDRSGEWTLLVTSGRFGDKLAVGMRTLADSDLGFARFSFDPCDLLVAASMSNRRAASALSRFEAKVKLFAPSIRNMVDRDPPVSQFARHVDVLTCNRLEWESLDDREEVAWRVSLLVVTDGPAGAMIRYTDETGDARRLFVPAFPREHPPKDTNRAGEAFAATLVDALLDRGWTPGVASPEVVAAAATRASAAAALVLDQTAFGFPSPDAIEAAVERGRVGPRESRG